MLTDLSIKDFLAQTASDTPTPGGGSVAALSASLAAALAEMVARLTIGKKGYEKHEEQMRINTKKALAYRDKFIKDIDRDAEAYGHVMAAYKLPKNTDNEIYFRTQAVQKALEQACLVPLGVAVDTFEMMEMLEDIVEKGNKNAVTDGAVATMMAKTAVLSALYNVQINLLSIDDDTFVEKVTRQIKTLKENATDLEQKILSKTDL